MKTVEEIYNQANAIRKDNDGKVRERLVGRSYAGGYHAVRSGQRYEGCDFFDAQLRLEGVEDVQFVGCRLNAATIYMRDAKNIDIVSNDFGGEWQHDATQTDLPNNRKGPSACIRTDGPISGVRVYNNRFVGVLRAWTGIVNAPYDDITFGFNLYSGLVRSHHDLNRGECILFHHSAGDHAVTNVRSFHDTWQDWNPVDHHGDMQPGNGQTWHGGKKPAIDFFNVNASDIHLYRPTLGRNDVLRFIAPDGGKIRRINVEEAITDGAGISRGGDVANIQRTLLGGGTMRIID